VATTITSEQTEVARKRDPVANLVGSDADKVRQSRLTSEQVWQAVARASFAVVSYVTPAGQPRSSGVVYKALDRRLYTAVARDSWKARHIGARGEVSVTVPIRRGGLLSLALPIPPATVSFHATAKVHPAGSAEARSALKALGALLPPERRDAASVIEVSPQGGFLTYGLGVSLTAMRDPAAALARIPVMSGR
jgi:pyridoxamine 5'-phosphate oxidase-like protein